MNPIKDMAASTWLLVVFRADDRRTARQFAPASTTGVARASNDRFQAPNNRGLRSK
jgi:hypothetical protein